MFIDEDHKYFLLTPHEKIISKEYRNWLKSMVNGDKKMTQRGCPTYMQDILLAADMKGITLVREYEIPLVDDVFPHERYLRDFKNSDKCLNPAADILLDACCRLAEQPEIAARVE